jgi:hypothetical protein
MAGNFKNITAASFINDGVVFIYMPILMMKGL